MLTLLPSCWREIALMIQKQEGLRKCWCVIETHSQDTELGEHPLFVTAKHIQQNKTKNKITVFHLKLFLLKQEKLSMRGIMNVGKHILLTPCVTQWERSWDPSVAEPMWQLSEKVTCGLNSKLNQLLCCNSIFTSLSDKLWIFKLWYFTVFLFF